MCNILHVINRVNWIKLVGTFLFRQLIHHTIQMVLFGVKHESFCFGIITWVGCFFLLSFRSLYFVRCFMCFHVVLALGENWDMGINEVDMISDNWLCFILMGHLFMHFLCGFDLIKTRKEDTQQRWGK